MLYVRPVGFGSGGLLSLTNGNGLTGVWPRPTQVYDPLQPSFYLRWIFEDSYTPGLLAKYKVIHVKPRRDHIPCIPYPFFWSNAVTSPRQETSIDVFIPDENGVLVYLFDRSSDKSILIGNKYKLPAFQNHLWFYQCKMGSAGLELWKLWWEMWYSFVGQQFIQSPLKRCDK